MDVLREFLEFIEYSKPQPVAELLSRVLLKSRRLTGAEAGSVFIARGRGKTRRLEAADIQNDRVDLEPASFVVPLNTSSIAGYTATTGEMVFVADLYNIPDNLPFRFDPELRSKARLQQPFDAQLSARQPRPQCDRRRPADQSARRLRRRTGALRARAGGSHRSLQPHRRRRHRARRHGRAHFGAKHPPARTQSSPARTTRPYRGPPGRDRGSVPDLHQPAVAGRRAAR